MKGVYVVFAFLERDKDIEIGALGTIEFEKGVYAYVGSGQNSLEKRLKRHFAPTEDKHWHIDYFTSEARVFDFFAVPEGPNYECTLAQHLSNRSKPVERFGSSDCSCASHLFKLPESFSQSKTRF
ncbi:MAG: GIY-YIG nuclease family protein [Nanohaloarchaea archaeon]|nr:GIY-YIG nuclease family protein [Candidatus Nanohaloarchaea archaeon]